VALAELYESFLTRVQFANPMDSQRYTGLLLQVREYLDRNPNAAATIYLMSWQQERGQSARVRSLDENGEIAQLFQGAALVSGVQRRDIYPGDRDTRAPDELTVQIHLLNLRDGASNQMLVERVPAAAVWMPADMGVDTLVQAPPT
jgi:hypothetical protein